MSTAPTAKFGATTQWLRTKPARSSSRSSAPSPEVPITAWIPAAASTPMLARTAAATVKSTTASTPAATNSSTEPAEPIAASSSVSGSASTARQASAPMRPVAPQTPSLIMGLV